MAPSKIAIVSPRFHPDVAGGAEKLALDYSLILKKYFTVEIFTTCAKDYITWKNELPQGTQNLNGILIHRYSVEKNRDIKKMNRILDFCLSKGDNVDPDSEELFLKEQGPYSPDLVNAVLSEESKFSLIILIGYLYYPIIKIVPKLKSKLLIIPTFHEEPALSLPIYRRTFLPIYNYSFNSPEEATVYKHTLKCLPKNHVLIGTYVHIPEMNLNIQKESQHLSPMTLLTLGRIEAAKGYAELFEYFDRFQHLYDTTRLRWISIGSNHLKLSEIPENIEIKGYVSEAEKANLISNATLIINPSPYESFSIAMMEAWSYRKPVLVNGKSEVMRNHNFRSQGGLHYSDEISFRRCLEYLLEHPDIRIRLGENGKKYVEANFTKEIIERKLLDTINKLLY